MELGINTGPLTLGIFFFSTYSLVIYFGKKLFTSDGRTVRNLSFFIRLCKSSLNLDNYFRQSALKASPITSLQWALEDTTSRTCTWLRLCKLKPRLEWRSETEVNCLSYGILEVKGYQVGILILRPNELEIFLCIFHNWNSLIFSKLRIKQSTTIYFLLQCAILNWNQNGRRVFWWN